MHIVHPNRTSTAARSTLMAAMAVVLPAAFAFAGQPVEWDKIPKAVQATVLANGGKAGPVDVEKETKDGQTIYEAEAKGKDGNVRDLVITADGKLVEIKDDDASDKAAERTARRDKVLAGIKFSHPTHITNPYLPLATLQQDIIEGTEGESKVRVERTVKSDIHRTFQIAGQTVEALVFEDRATKNGELEEVTLDYFAQDDNGNVYYLGEDVDEYKGGKVIGHAGSWTLGRDTEVPGLLFPGGEPKVGANWLSEDVNDEIMEKDEIVEVGATTTVPAGTFKDCVKVKETTPDGVEYKYYAKGVGVVREVPAGGDEQLVKHTTK